MPLNFLQERVLEIFKTIQIKILEEVELQIIDFFLVTGIVLLEPTNGSYLDDTVLNGQSPSNRRIVFKRINFSFLRVLDTLGGEYKDVSRFRAVTL